MTLWLAMLSGGTCLVAVLLLIKLLVMKKSMREMERALADKLVNDTNTLIDLSSRDRDLCRLGDELNRQLRILRRERRRYQQGDLQLKEAITNISHDLRTPLTAIYGYLDLLRQEELPAKARRYLERIENRARALTKLTEALFAYSLVTSSREQMCEVVAVNQILEESLLSFYAAMQQRGITPTLRLPERRVERYLDPLALGRIFANIINNALKYSDGDFDVHMDEKGKIVFANTARTLTPILVGRLFERYYTVQTGQNATGLGLSIAKTLTERMGGSMKAAYAGERFTLTLFFPMADGEREKEDADAV